MPRSINRSSRLMGYRQVESPSCTLFFAAVDPHIGSMRRSEKRPADRSDRQDKSHLMVARTKATNNQLEFSNSPESRRRSAQGGGVETMARWAIVPAGKD